ncbi:MAG: SgcJ/EcaC family oxidoreductase [Pseudomonadota bacterium]
MELTSPTEHAPPDTPVASALAADWAAAWNRHDSDALARLVDSDIDFVTVAGHWLKGAEAFRRHHADIHRGQMRDSVWRNMAWTERRVGAGLVLVHLRWAMSGDRDPDGTPRSPRRGIFSWLVACPESSSHGARIIAGQNTNVRADVS